MNTTPRRMNLVYLSTSFARNHLPRSRRMRARRPSESKWVSHVRSKMKSLLNFTQRWISKVNVFKNSGKRINLKVSTRSIRTWDHHVTRKKRISLILGQILHIWNKAQSRVVSWVPPMTTLLSFLCWAGWRLD